jgi:hypothetical protein
MSYAWLAFADSYCFLYLDAGLADNLQRYVQQHWATRKKSYYDCQNEDGNSYIHKQNRLYFRVIGWTD